MSTSIPPPDSGSGNTKYAVIGIILLFVAGGGIWLAMKPKPAAPPPAETHAVVQDSGVTEPVRPTVGADFALPTEEPDAGEADAGDAGVQVAHGVRRGGPVVSGCTGAVDPAGVARVVRQSDGALRACYNRQLRTNPALQGSLTAQWAINPNGSASQIVTAGSVTRDRTFKACFESTLSRLRFPPARGNCAYYQQSFTFRPGN